MMSHETLSVLNIIGQQSDHFLRRARGESCDAAEPVAACGESGLPASKRLRKPMRHSARRRNAQRKGAHYRFPAECPGLIRIGYCRSAPLSGLARFARPKRRRELSSQWLLIHHPHPVNKERGHESLFSYLLAVQRVLRGSCSNQRLISPLVFVGPKSASLLSWFSSRRLAACRICSLGIDSQELASAGHLPSSRSSARPSTTYQFASG